MKGKSAGRPVIGIIGGTGVYQMDGLDNPQWVRVGSAFGEPSDELLIGDLGGVQMVFLPRHGRGHRLMPSEINYRANIEVLKRAGATQVISFSAAGSLREELRPGMFVLVDQFIDRTFARRKSFFGDGLVAHVSMAQPVCSRIGDALQRAAQEAATPIVRGGTYLVMEGPQFSSLAESELYRSWGCDLIGMTNMPEAKLAREAELCYATVAMVTDYDCWHPGHDAVSVEAVVKVLHENAEHARTVIRNAAPVLAAGAGPCPCGCDRALEQTVITAPDARDPAAVRRLSVIAGRVLGTAAPGET